MFNFSLCTIQGNAFGSYKGSEKVSHCQMRDTEKIHRKLMWYLMSDRETGEELLSGSVCCYAVNIANMKENCRNMVQKKNSE